MKRKIGLILASCLMLTCLSAAADGECWYYVKHGTHDFEQVDVMMPSCETDGYYLLECRQCGLNEKHVTEKAIGHTWKMVESVGATCDEEGYEKYVCQECDKARTTTFPKLHHEWVDGEVLEIATCSQEGCVRTYCSLCHVNSNRRTAKTAHKYGNWNVTMNATDHSQGKRERVCPVCGDKQAETFYPEGTLYRGMDQSDDVASCQQMLIDLGFLKDKADGMFGKKTEQAVKDFQSENGLESTGIVYPQTQSAIAERHEMLMNPTAEPETPTSAPDDEFPEIVYCACELDDEGVERVTYCAGHKALLDEFEAQFLAAETEDAKLLALNESQSVWQAELDRLYDAYLSSAAPEEKPGIAQAKSMFALYLQNQEALWTRKYASQPDIVQKNIVNAIARQCAYLCPLAEANDMELKSFSFSLSGMSIDQCRVYSVARTEEAYQAEYDLYAGRTVFTLRMDGEDIEGLTTIIQSHDLKKWDGFHRTNSLVMDGSSFGLWIEFDDGTTVNATGINEYPEGYSTVAYGFCDFFENLMRKNGINLDE